MPINLCSFQLSAVDNTETTCQRGENKKVSGYLFHTCCSGHIMEESRHSKGQMGRPAAMKGHLSEITTAKHL